MKAGRFGRARAPLAGGLLIALGVLLLGSGAGYLAYSARAESKLPNLNQELPPDADLLSGSQPKENLIPSASGDFEEALAALRSLRELRGTESVRRFTFDELPKTVGLLPPALYLEIPKVGISSRVMELGTYWTDDVLLWERPKQAVGHLKGTANPGEKGNIALAGHLESRIRGEGNDFKNLPLVAERLDSGEIIYAYLYTETARYTYVITRSQVVPPEEVEELRPTPDPQLTLITCVPDGVYKERLVVNAKLVAIEPLYRWPR